MADIEKERSVAFYAAIVDAWIGSSMERDKSILYIASGAIGLLVTLVTTTKYLTRWEFLFYFIALLAFLSTIIIVLIIFQRNTVFLAKLKADAENPEQPASSGDPVLFCLDKALLVSFGVGMLFSFGVAVINLNNHVLVKEAAMEDKLENSLDGLNKMSPKSEGRSLNGLEAMQPRPAQPQAGTPPPPPADKPVAPKKD